MIDLASWIEESAPPSLGEAKIAEWEARNRVHLPTPLREVLLHRDGGNLRCQIEFSFSDTDFSGGIEGVCIGRILGLAEHPHGWIQRVTEWLVDIEVSLAGVPESMFIFADNWDGNAITFDSHSGEVGLIEIETAGSHFRDPETYSPLAKNLYAFLANPTAFD